MMGISIREKSVEEIEAKLVGMTTDLNQIAYLESALKADLTYDVKRFIWDKLVELYEARGMFDKAGRAMQGKAGVEVSFKDKIESYLSAGELYAKAKKLEDAEEMFLRAYRNAKGDEKLIKMPLDELEKKEIKEKLVGGYRALGRFKDAELVGGV